MLLLVLVLLYVRCVACCKVFRFELLFENYELSFARSSKFTSSLCDTTLDLKFGGTESQSH